MTTIYFDENIKLNKKRFKSLDDFQLYLLENLQKSELSTSHKMTIDERIREADSNPENFISLDELKVHIKRP